MTGPQAEFPTGPPGGLAGHSSGPGELTDLARAGGIPGYPITEEMIARAAAWAAAGYPRPKEGAVSLDLYLGTAAVTAYDAVPYGLFGDNDSRFAVVGFQAADFKTQNAGPVRLLSGDAEHFRAMARACTRAADQLNAAAAGPHAE